MLRTRSNRNVLSPIQIQEQARATALLVAQATVRMFERGHWSSEFPLAAETLHVAQHVVCVDRDLGIVCDADLAEFSISQMAQGAHQLMGQARDALLTSRAMIVCPEDLVVIDQLVEQTLIMAYGLLVC